MGEWIRAAPEIFLVCAISVILVVDVFLPPAQRRVTFYLTMLALLGTGLCSAYFGAGERTTLLYDSFVSDPAGNALKLFAYAIVAISRHMGVRFSITIRQHKSLRNLIEAIPEEDWTPIPYWLDGAADAAETTYAPSRISPTPRRCGSSSGG